MFTVKLTFEKHPLGGLDDVTAKYESVGECINDIGLRTLFDDEDLKITSCVVTKDGRRVTSIPIMTWERFKAAVTTNAAELMAGEGV